MVILMELPVLVTGICVVPVYVLYKDLLLSFRVRTTVRLITTCSMLISDLLTCEYNSLLWGVHYKVQRFTFGGPVSPSVIQYQSLNCWTDIQMFYFEGF